MDEVKHNSGGKKRSFKKLGLSKTIWLVLTVLVLASAGTAAYFINRYNDSQKEVKRLSNPTEAAKDEQTRLIAKIGSLVVLPKGETPAVATVADISKVKDQPFFAGAQNGDKILIYTKAKKAILYRPSTNKIINVAPVNIGKSTAGTSTQTNTTKTP